MEPVFVFKSDSRSVYTGEIDKDFLNWDFYLMFGLFNISLLCFGLDRLHCILLGQRSRVNISRVK